MKISNKGQIVIPKHLRDRLNIKPGMEVNWRIRGQFLVVELKTDVKKNIEFLNSKDLGAEGLDEEMCTSIIRDLVYQQFYTGSDDKITDRIGNKVVQVRGADAIIRTVIDVLAYASRHWRNGHPVETLREFAHDFELDFPTVIARFSTKIENMLLGGEDLIQLMGGEVVYAMAVGEILSQFRTRIGDLVTESLFKDAHERGYIAKLDYETVENLITKSLADEYSILMNLKVLQEFAKINLNTVGKFDYDKLAAEMLDSYKNEETPIHIIKRRERRAKRQNKKIKPSKKTTKSTNIRPKSFKVLEKSTDKKDEQIPDLPDFDF